MRRIDEMLVNSGIRKKSASILFTFVLYPISDADALLDLSLAMYAPPSELKRMLCTKEEHCSKRGTVRYTSPVFGTEYILSGHMFPLPRGRTAVWISVSGIGEHPDNGDGRFAHEGDAAYRHFVDIILREHRLSLRVAGLATGGGGHLFREAILERDTEQIQQAMSSDPTARMVALAAGQHARLGERSLISTLDPDLFRVVAGFAYDDALKSARNQAVFYPSLGKDAVSMVDEIIEMRSVLAERFSIIHASSCVWQGGHCIESIATSGGPIRYDRTHRFSGRSDSGSDDCIILINGITYKFSFRYHGLPCVWMHLFAARDIVLTGMDSFMVLVRLLEQRLTLEDRARTSYDELVPPYGLMYGSEQMRIVRMLKSDSNRSEERHISFVLDIGAFDSVVSGFDNAFRHSVQSDHERRHVRLITVKGHEYAVHMEYCVSAKDWVCDHAYCTVYGIYESDEAYGSFSSNFIGKDAFSAFVERLAEDI